MVILLRSGVPRGLEARNPTRPHQRDCGSCSPEHLEGKLNGSCQGSGLGRMQKAGILAIRFPLFSCCRRCRPSKLNLQSFKEDRVLLRSFRRPTVPFQCLSVSSHTQKETSISKHSDQFRLIYRFPGIHFCRILSRLKLLQTSLTVLLLPPIWVLYWQNQVPQSQCLYCTGIACFAAAMLYGMSFYLRRIVGMMYLNGDDTLLKVSHLTFWGKRKDICCPVETVMTLGDVGENRNDLLLKFQQYNQDLFLYFSLRFGNIVDPKGFAKVFGELG
ncbi:LOW QUALITY PROTEIN: transmembrane protein 186 [Anolis sagrei]|uniref:LOW QUALITY PROTEIN: transmembrane protein 186 n=1 Tax=Anolis sagrei TaxID=38937 RepID=UPI003520781D